MHRIEVNIETGVKTTVQLTQKEIDTATIKKLTPEYITSVKNKKVSASKLLGIEILGVMCSATKADQMGLTAVGLDYSMTTAAGGTFASTKFSFENGNVLVITADNFATVYNTWVPFRRSFFAMGE